MQIALTDICICSSYELPSCPPLLYQSTFPLPIYEICVTMLQTCQHCVLWNFWICQSVVTEYSINMYFSFEKWDCASFQSYLYFFFHELPLFNLGIVFHHISVYFYYSLLFILLIVVVPGQKYFVCFFLYTWTCQLHMVFLKTVKEFFNSSPPASLVSFIYYGIYMQKCADMHT